MNVELLRKVQRAILTEPARVDMWTWADLAEDRIRVLRDRGAEHVETLPPCGTIGCIAGWACLVELKDPRAGLVYRQRKLGTRHWMAEDEARRKLGVDTEEGDRLFRPEHWPSEFEDALGELVAGTPEYATVVANRIDHFIKTKGAE